MFGEENDRNAADLGPGHGGPENPMEENLVIGGQDADEEAKSSAKPKITYTNKAKSNVNQGYNYLKSGLSSIKEKVTGQA